MRYIYFCLLTFFSFNSFGQNIDDLSFGTDSTLDIMTWNIEHFPKEGQTTIDYVTQIIYALDPDVIAMQEVDVPADFETFIAQLDGYEGYYQNNEYARLAYIYKSDLQVNDIFQIFTQFQYSNVFPRPPIVMDITFNGENVILINNHLKCCGNGILDPSNTSDEENRRRLAVNTLHSYMTATYPENNIILMGDLNDILTENDPDNNVFATWTEDSANFKFADMDIAEGPESGWSYPSWPSHLDHMLVSNELFDELDDPNTTIEVLKIDNFFPGGWNGYDSNVSDHRPVGISFVPSITTGLASANSPKMEFAIAPNPVQDQCSFRFSPLSGNGSIVIYSITGQKMAEFKIGSGQNTLDLNMSDYAGGMYFATLISDQKVATTVKIQVIR